jgi:murein DD-endopeptidase MepM/ murein hydrolase activator NlpD
MKRIFFSLRHSLAVCYQQTRRSYLGSYLGFVLIGLLLITGLGQVVPAALHQAAIASPDDNQIARASEPWQVASFPVEGFQAYTSAFGYRGEGFHYGLDIAAPMGSYIRNWWEGTVVEVSDDSACGTSIVVESGDWEHIYCHMQGYVTHEGDRWTFVDSEGGLQIAEGQTVYTGDRIGRVGMTGRTTGPHLHWGMRYQGSWADPGLVLQAMVDGQRRASLPQ